MAQFTFDSPTAKRVVQVIYAAVDQINGQLPKGERLEKCMDTPLFGGESKLDSLGLVNLVVAIESGVEEEFGVPVTLTDEETVARSDGPFRTAGTLAQHIVSLLENASDVR